MSEFPTWTPSKKKKKKEFPTWKCKSGMCVSNMHVIDITQQLRLQPIKGSYS